jgi:hypothetical protein
MAKASPELIASMRRAAEKLRTSQLYQWGHMGSCNCGFLAQEITQLSKKEIHARALRTRSGDWNEQLIDYCPGSGLPMDEVISEMFAAGLDSQDLMQLEKLSNPTIIKRLPENQKPLQHNKKGDVVLYLETWACLLEEQYLLQTKAKERKVFLRENQTKPTPKAPKAVEAKEEMQVLTAS